MTDVRNTCAIKIQIMLRNNLQITISTINRNV